MRFIGAPARRRCGGAAARLASARRARLAWRVGARRAPGSGNGNGGGCFGDGNGGPVIPLAPSKPAAVAVAASRSERSESAC